MLILLEPINTVSLSDQFPSCAALEPIFTCWDERGLRNFFAKLWDDLWTILIWNDPWSFSQTLHSSLPWKLLSTRKLRWSAGSFLSLTQIFLDRELTCEKISRVWRLLCLKRRVSWSNAEWRILHFYSSLIVNSHRQSLARCVLSEFARKRHKKMPSKASCDRWITRIYHNWHI